ncbi:MAG TPA: hypothetical protein VLC93_03185, partial [Myxococcota bacterium]|nr:hypothetical protein [Myxococcota bacterium]
MRARRRHISGVILALIVASCGGGGAGSNNDDDEEDCELSQSEIETLCNDARFCLTWTFNCATRTCSYLSRNCDDGNACTNDSCDESADTCVSTPRGAIGSEGSPGSTACSDGLDND